MANDPVTQLENELNETKQPDHCFRPHQRVALEEEAERLKRTIDLPDSVTGTGKPHARLRYQQVIKMLAEQAPRAIEEPLQKDRIAKLRTEVLETVIKPSMLTKAEMRRNPAGAVGEFMRRENSPHVQKGIRQWKRAQFALEPTTMDEDHALVEKYRQEGTPYGTSSFMPNAQIPGVFAQTPLAKEHWPLPAPETTAIEQIKTREKRVMGEAQKAALAAGRAKAAENRRLATEVVPT